ncbi:hypothetical protein [Neobacillus niacini]|uniref:hypothetical protein n=1 Tax=Neobacillus niacini TaxID=86668 RepID=UPI002FFF56B1
MLAAGLERTRSPTIGKIARVAAVINQLLNIKFSPSEPSPRSSDPPISVTRKE